MPTSLRAIALLLAGCSVPPTLAQAPSRQPLPAPNHAPAGNLLASQCEFKPAFEQPDERGTQRVRVFSGTAEPASGNASPLAFISTLKVNTDGTRISYKVNDPRAQDGGINDMRNAMLKGRTIAEFEAIAAAKWQPVDSTWRVLSANVIERDTRAGSKGSPCVTSDGFLVSMTSDVSVAGGFGRVGDCDQSKWIDALTVPALVLPVPAGGKPTGFDSASAKTRNLVVAMTTATPRHIALGIVGDKGPADELGEASVAMNRILNGLPQGDQPRNAKDAIARFQAPEAIVVVFPGASNRLDYPVTPQRVQEAAKRRFEAWGGQARLEACLPEIVGQR